MIQIYQYFKFWVTIEFLQCLQFSKKITQCLNRKKKHDVHTKNDISHYNQTQFEGVLPFIFHVIMDNPIGAGFSVKYRRKNLYCRYHLHFGTASSYGWMDGNSGTLWDEKTCSKISTRGNYWFGMSNDTHLKGIAIGVYSRLQLSTVEVTHVDELKHTWGFMSLCCSIQSYRDVWKWREGDVLR